MIIIILSLDINKPIYDNIISRLILVKGDD